MKTSLARVGAAIATSALCLFALAGPASATTESLSLTGGTITVGGDAFAVNGGTTACSSTTSTITAEVDTTAGKISVTDLATRSLVQVGANWYYVTMQEDTTLGATDGNYIYSPPTRNITDLQVGVVATIDNAASGSSSCASNGGAVLCTAATIVELDGSFTGDGKTTGDTFTLSGSDITGGLQAWPTCNAGPFLTNEAVSVSGLTGLVA